MNEARKSIRRKPNREIYLLQDNAPIHTSMISQAAITKAGFKPLIHPPYSPDIAPSDFYVFRLLNKHLRGNHFSSANELEQSVRSFFESQPNEFYEKAFDELVTRWRKCVEVFGSYIEK